MELLYILLTLWCLWLFCFYVFVSFKAKHEIIDSELINLTKIRFKRIFLFLKCVWKRTLNHQHYHCNCTALFVETEIFFRKKLRIIVIFKLKRFLLTTLFIIYFFRNVIKKAIKKLMKSFLQNIFFPKIVSMKLNMSFDFFNQKYH